jgi:predicted O-linked N-acetylglucosamine transferase (SPINDLY family)
MQVLDCVASSPAQYVELAVQLGTNPARRDAISAKILGANGALYDNQHAACQLVRFFKQAIEQKCNL